jgi:zinc and cadmium transporter
VSTLAYILIFSFIGSVASLAGGIILLSYQKLAYRISHLLASFAAGALLGTAFLDLLPEALEEAPEGAIFTWALGGLLTFFVLERFLHWFHHHHEHVSNHEIVAKPVVALVILGDSLHNFIDGLVVGAAFLVDIRLGIITALATAAHEIPQEMGDFGILLQQGLSKAKVLTYNIVSSLATMVGAVLVYLAGDSIVHLLPVFLATTAGFFTYIAASDLIPEIHSHKSKRGFAVAETLLLFSGVVVVWGAIRLLEG